MSRPLATVPTLLLLLAACGTESGGDPADAGGDGTGDGTGAGERLVVSPSSIEFVEVEIGETDVQALLLRNGGSAEVVLSQIALVETAATVRFTTAFLREVAEKADWADLDGDGHDFESRDGTLVLAPDESLQVVLQFRPDGQPLGCFDRAPAPCGFLLLSGQEQTVSVPVFVPR